MGILRGDEIAFDLAVRGGYAGDIWEMSLRRVFDVIFAIKGDKNGKGANITGQWISQNCNVTALGMFIQDKARAARAKPAPKVQKEKEPEAPSQGKKNWNSLVGTHLMHLSQIQGSKTSKSLPRNPGEIPTS